MCAGGVYFTPSGPGFLIVTCNTPQIFCGPFMKMKDRRTIRHYGFELFGRDEIVVGDDSPYGVADDKTIEAIRLLARAEGLIADPVYEGKAVCALLELAKRRRFFTGSRILLIHLGGTPAVHAYANKFEAIDLTPFPA